MADRLRPWESLERLKLIIAQGHELRCVECGAVDQADPGWRIYRDVDDELVTYCDDCAPRELGA